jgi:hypothetical protein
MTRPTFKVFAQSTVPRMRGNEVAMLDPSAWYKFSEAVDAEVVRLIAERQWRRISEHAARKVSTGSWRSRGTKDSAAPQHERPTDGDQPS